MSTSDNSQKKYNTRLAQAVKAATNNNKAAANNIKAKSALKLPVEKPHESSDDDDEAEDEEDEEEDASETDASETDASETDASETGEEDASETGASETGASETDASDEEDIEETEDEDEDEDYTASGDEGEVDEKLEHHEYQKFLSELFPSKYINDKVAMAHKKSGNRKCPGAPKKARREKEEEEEEDDDDYLDANVTDRRSKKGAKNPMKNFNISFIMADQRQDDGFEYMSETEALYDEMYSDGDSEPEPETEKEKNKKKKEEKKGDTVADELAAFTKMKSLYETLSPAEQSNPVIKKMVDDLKAKEQRFLKKEELKSKKKKIENTKKLKTLLRERDVMNDLQYFNEKMSVQEQEHALQQISEIKKHNDITKPYRLSLLDAAIPSQYKAIAYRKISSLRNMEPGGGDYYKMKNWVDTFMQIPFGQYKNLPITLADGVEKCHDFMDNAKQILDQAVYGLNDAKLQIMQMVGQWIVNPSAIGTAIAIKGPMGTGKTTLVKEGISKILGRDFVFIALGGATDSSFLEGHSYTYEGSSWGKIVDLLIKCKSMNPVIYFDELDKISDTPKGEEIAGILTHLTDTAQNNQFHDRYFSEIDFDLSRCLFIFSYNDESKVNKILLDRMYRIQTQGYNQEQKTTISNKYLLPKICEQVKFQTTDITISEETLHYIISNYTDKEDGVRTLKRCLEIIYTKLNLYRLMRPDTNIFESEMSIKVEFPMQVTPEIVDKLIKKIVDTGSWHNMYM
jgi:ATP-dependent Lon protease